MIVVADSFSIRSKAAGRKESSRCREDKGYYRISRWSADVPSVLEKVTGGQCWCTWRCFRMMIFTGIYCKVIGRATGPTEIREDSISSRGRILQLTGKHLSFMFSKSEARLQVSPTLNPSCALSNQDASNLQIFYRSIKHLTCFKIHAFYFTTLGDLKLIERPGVYTIAPHGFQSIKATIKVLSFLWFLSAVTDQSMCVGVFDRDHAQFRSMWTEFE